MTRVHCVGELDWPLGCEYLMLGFRRSIDLGAELRVTFSNRGPERDRAWFTADDLGLLPVVRFIDDEEDLVDAERAADIVLTARLGTGVALRDATGRSTAVAHREPDALAVALLEWHSGDPR